MIIYCTVCGASADFVQVGRKGSLKHIDFSGKCQTIKEKLAQGEKVAQGACPNMDEAMRRASRP